MECGEYIYLNCYACGERKWEEFCDGPSDWGHYQKYGDDSGTLVCVKIEEQSTLEKRTVTYSLILCLNKGTGRVMRLGLNYVDPTVASMGPNMCKVILYFEFASC